MYQVFVTVQLCHGRVSISHVYTAVPTFSMYGRASFFHVRPCHGFFMYDPWYDPWYDRVTLMRLAYRPIEKGAIVLFILIDTDTR